MVTVDDEDAGVFVPVVDARGSGDVSVILREVIMDVFNLFRIMRGPKPCRREHGGCSNETERRNGCRQAGGRSEPACKRIVDQPADMRQGELRGKERRRVFRM